MTPSEMTTVELLEDAACEAMKGDEYCTDDGCSKKTRAAALLSRAARIREALARLEAQRGTPAGLAPARAALDALRAINAPTPKEGL